MKCCVDTCTSDVDYQVTIAVSLDDDRGRDLYGAGPTMVTVPLCGEHDAAIAARTEGLTIVLPD